MEPLSNGRTVDRGEVVFWKVFSVKIMRDHIFSFTSGEKWHQWQYWSNGKKALQLYVEHVLSGSDGATGYMDMVMRKDIMFVPKVHSAHRMEDQNMFVPPRRDERCTGALIGVSHVAQFSMFAQPTNVMLYNYNSLTWFVRTGNLELVKRMIEILLNSTLYVRVNIEGLAQVALQRWSKQMEIEKAMHGITNEKERDRVSMVISKLQYKEIFEYIIDKGIYDSETTLCACMELNHIEAVKIVLSRGLDYSIYSNPFGISPFNVCKLGGIDSLQYGHENALRIAAGGDKEWKSLDIRNFLHTLGDSKCHTINSGYCNICDPSKTLSDYRSKKITKGRRHKQQQSGSDEDEDDDNGGERDTSSDVSDDDDNDEEEDDSEDEEQDATVVYKEIRAAASMAVRLDSDDIDETERSKRMKGIDKLHNDSDTPTKIDVKSTLKPAPTFLPTEDISDSVYTFILEKNGCGYKDQYRKHDNQLVRKSEGIISSIHCYENLLDPANMLCGLDVSCSRQYSGMDFENHLRETKLRAAVRYTTSTGDTSMCTSGLVCHAVRFCNEDMMSLLEKYGLCVRECHLFTLLGNGSPGEHIEDMALEMLNKMDSLSCIPDSVMKNIMQSRMSRVLSVVYDRNLSPCGPESMEKAIETGDMDMVRVVIDHGVPVTLYNLTRHYPEEQYNELADLWLSSELRKISPESDAHYHNHDVYKVKAIGLAVIMGHMGILKALRGSIQIRYCDDSLLVACLKSTSIAKHTKVFTYFVDNYIKRPLGPQVVFDILNAAASAGNLEIFQMFSHCTNLYNNDPIIANEEDFRRLGSSAVTSGVYKVVQYILDSFGHKMPESKDPAGYLYEVAVSHGMYDIANRLNGIRKHLRNVGCFSQHDMNNMLRAREHKLCLDAAIKMEGKLILDNIELIEPLLTTDSIDIFYKTINVLNFTYNSDSISIQQNKMPYIIQEGKFWIVYRAVMKTDDLKLLEDKMDCLLRTYALDPTGKTYHDALEKRSYILVLGAASSKKLPREKLEIAMKYTGLDLSPYEMFSILSNCGFDVCSYVLHKYQNNITLSVLRNMLALMTDYRVKKVIKDIHAWRTKFYEMNRNADIKGNGRGDFMDWRKINRAITVKFN
jgi:hypothetical protein